MSMCVCKCMYLSVEVLGDFIQCFLRYWLAFFMRKDFFVFFVSATLWIWKYHAAREYCGIFLSCSLVTSWIAGGQKETHLQQFRWNDFHLRITLYKTDSNSLSVSFFNVPEYLEKWLNGYEYWLLLLRTWVWIPAPMLWFTISEHSKQLQGIPCPLLASIGFMHM